MRVLSQEINLWRRVLFGFAVMLCGESVARSWLKIKANKMSLLLFRHIPAGDEGRLCKRWIASEVNTNNKFKRYVLLVHAGG